MNEIKAYTESIFESIKHIDENGVEYWEARELQKVLEYSQWRRFKELIIRSMNACKLSNYNTIDHFVEIGKMVPMPSGASPKTIEDYKLSRYACYLIVQNGDSKKKVIALGQTYFAIQTRKQEISEEEFKNLSEDEKRLYTRKNIKNKNKYLFKAAQKAGVENFGKFNNSGYQGLYNGENASDVAKRKGITENEDILDYMGSEELGANLFRITQTEAKLKREEIKKEDDACDAHYKVGKAVRKTIELLGGTMPEELPTPEKSIQELENEKSKKISSK